MQGRLDEAEAAALKGGKKVIQKLETKVNSKIVGLSFSVIHENFDLDSGFGR